MKNTQRRGIITEALINKYNITQKELRLMPYLQYLLVNNMPIDPNKIDAEERKILQKWRNEGKISFSMSEPCTITQSFWIEICNVLFDGYVLKKED